MSTVPSNHQDRQRLSAQTELDVNELEELFSSLSRQPFVQELSRFVAANPSRAKIREFAEKYPDRWAQGVSILARLAGYSEKVDVSVSGLIQHVRALSDVELESRLKIVNQELQSVVDMPANGPKTTIDVQVNQEVKA